MSVIIYVEGGGTGDPSLTRCRRAFGEFFARLLPSKDRVRVVPWGGRSETFKAFALAHKSPRPGYHVILLVDSEGPVEGYDVSPWDYLGQRAEDKWQKPKTAEDDQAHLMVQCMEAWFMADREAVVKYFDKGLEIDDLPGPVNGDIERIPRAKIAAALDKAARRVHKARGTKRQGYDKVEDGFSLLEAIEPRNVCQTSKRAEQLRLALERKLRDRP